MPSKLILVTLVQIASAESNHADGTAVLLVVAAKTVRAPLIVGATCVPHDVMLPSILTQVLLIGIIEIGGTDIGGIVGVVVGVGETAVGITVANAPVKLRPNTAIAVKRIAAIIVFFFVIVFILIISSF